MIMVIEGNEKMKYSKELLKQPTGIMKELKSKNFRGVKSRVPGNDLEAVLKSAGKAAWKNGIDYAVTHNAGSRGYIILIAGSRKAENTLNIQNGFIAAKNGEVYRTTCGLYQG